MTEIQVFRLNITTNTSEYKFEIDLEADDKIGTLSGEKIIGEARGLFLTPVAIGERPVFMLQAPCVMKIKDEEVNLSGGEAIRLSIVEKVTDESGAR